MMHIPIIYILSQAQVCSPALVLPPRGHKGLDQDMIGVAFLLLSFQTSWQRKGTAWVGHSPWKLNAGNERALWDLAQHHLYAHIVKHKISTRQCDSPSANQPGGFCRHRPQRGRIAPQPSSLVTKARGLSPHIQGDDRFHTNELSISMTDIYVTQPLYTNKNYIYTKHKSTRCMSELVAGWTKWIWQIRQLLKPIPSPSYPQFFWDPIFQAHKKTSNFNSSITTFSGGGDSGTCLGAHKQTHPHDHMYILWILMNR